MRARRKISVLGSGKPNLPNHDTLTIRILAKLWIKDFIFATLKQTIHTSCFLLMKQFFFVVFAFALLAIGAQTSCYYDNEVEQYGTTVCDTVALSFSQDIQPIINASCITCHAPGGEQESTPFTTYEEIKLYTDGALVERIQGIGGIMPPSGAISSCNQLKIAAWVNAGAPNN